MVAWHWLNVISVGYLLIYLVAKVLPLKKTLMSSPVTVCMIDCMNYNNCLLHVISRAFCETIRMTFGVCVCMCVCMCVCVCVCVQGISPSITGRILMKLRMDIPVHHAQCVWQTIENRSKVKVKVTENTKTTIWAITFEPEVVEISGCQNIYQKCRSHHDAWRNVFASHDVK